MLDFFKPKTQHPDETHQGLLARLKKGLSKTRHVFSNSLSNLLLGKKQIDQDLLKELKALLISADIGVETTEHIIQTLTEKVLRKELKDPEVLYLALETLLADILKPYEAPLQASSSPNPYVILMVGINGSGKTTTIGKLAKRLQEEGKKVILAAGDTFRAAAVEQLKIWGDKNNIEVISQKSGADSASVIFDALQAAKARSVDVLIADTAGRLHTQTNLMEELKKVLRVIKKLDENAPHEVMLVVDGGIGQNALSQAKIFHEALGLTGITLTKLDGTAKGGIIFNIVQTLKLPIRFVGLGEGIDDLKPFHAEEFVEALFSKEGTD